MRTATKYKISAFLPQPRYRFSGLSKTNRYQSLLSQQTAVVVRSSVSNSHLFLLKQDYYQQQVAAYPLSELKSNNFFRVLQQKMSSSTDNNNDIDTTELVNVGIQYQQVHDRVSAVASNIGRNDNVRLVAVSKTKPIALLEAAYNVGCRHYGENYVQEMIEKMALWHDRTDVHWHFIGALQSNKCQMLVNACNDITQLTVETVSSIKLATKLNNAVSNKLLSSSPPSQDDDDTVSLNVPEQRLKVFVQVNTSGEDSKSGVEPGEACIELCRYIVHECPLLELRGLMTIGAPGDTSCFTTLIQCQEDVRSDFDKSMTTTEESDVTNHPSSMTSRIPQTIELSMGMSDDFEQAIIAGSTNVRVGSTIFGHRNYST